MRTIYRAYARKYWNLNKKFKFGSGGVIRNYNHRNFYEIFFDRDSLKRNMRAID
jgi:hypothetical protein